MTNQFSRTEILLGAEGVEKLKKSTVAVFGVGGVGGYVVEALVRSGIENIHIVDNDTVSLTNINRQIIATHSTIGKDKVCVMKERILDINPQAKVTEHKCFFLPETKDLFDFTQYDYVVDAVDTVAAKIQLIVQAKEAGVPIISCMGAGNKLDPSQFQIADISKTSVCPLARVMRQECKKRHIQKVKVLFSTEKPVELHSEIQQDLKNEPGKKRSLPGSIAFVPSVAGLMIAGEVIKDLLKKD